MAKINLSSGEKIGFTIAGVAVALTCVAWIFLGKKSDTGTGTGTGTDPYNAVDERTPEQVYGPSQQGGSRRKRKNKKSKKSKKRC